MCKRSVTSYHVALHMAFYIWDFTGVIPPRLVPRSGKNRKRRYGTSRLRGSDEEGEDREKVYSLKASSTLELRSAQPANEHSASCDIPAPSPPLPSPRSSEIGRWFPPSTLRRGRRRRARREYPDRPLHATVARQPWEGERRVFQRFAMLSRSSLPPLLSSHSLSPSPGTIQLSSAARAIVRAQLSAFMTVDTLLLYSWRVT